MLLIFWLSSKQLEEHSRNFEQEHLQRLSTDLQLEEVRAEVNGLKNEKDKIKLTNAQLIMEIQELKHKYEPGNKACLSHLGSQ